MDRAIIYNGEQINASDIDYSNLFAMIRLAKLSKAILGSGPFINNLACIPDSPASLDIFLQPGEIYSIQNVDNTAYGDLPSDTTHQVLKQGILYSEQSFTLTAPPAPGDSINYLVQISYSDQDTDPENRPFFSGPPQTVDTIRRGLLVATLKPGNPAPTGTQVTPSPDVGNIGAWVITVDNAQTQITSSDITTYPNAPFITEKLSNKISQGLADARYGQIVDIQSGTYIYCNDSGAVNALTGTISPNITQYYEGMEVRVKVTNTNTGTSTINLNGLGAKQILSDSGQQIFPGNLMAGNISIFIYNGTEFILQNPVKTAIVSGVRMSANQSYPAPAISTKINFDTIDTEIGDYFGLWDATNKRFLLKYPGYYRISCSLKFSVAGDAETQLELHKNGSFVSIIDDSFTTGAAGLSGSILAKSDGTSYLELNIGTGVQGASILGSDPWESICQIEYLGPSL